jgi:precorrin-6B methylase 2
LKQEISENKKDFQEENEKLDNLIIQQKKDLKSNQNIIADLRKEVEEKIKAEELLNKWGYEDKYENNIVIISYEESSLYKLFFGDYIFINSNKRADNIVEKILQVDNNYIIINKAKLSTKKLLEIENVIDSNLKINLLSYTPKDFTIKIIKKLEEENFNIL